jgi:ribonuclease Z
MTEYNIKSNDKYLYSINQSTYLKIKIGKINYNIYGYSRAGFKTCIVIPDINTVFDYGYAEEKAYSISNKLISHGHMDHIGSLHTDHCFRKTFYIDKKQKYILPKQCILPYKMIASAYSHMNMGKTNDVILLDKLYNTDLIESEQCNLEHLSKEYYCTAFEMDHKVKSFGYIIYRKSKRVKKEYKNLKPYEYIKMREDNKEFTEEHYEPIVGYTGDTSINGVLKNPAFLTVPLLIMECTGFDNDDIHDVRMGGHIHIEDIRNNYTSFKNEKIVLYHISAKYKDINILNEYIDILDDEIKDKIVLFF